MMDLQELTENFAFFDGWEEKYQYVIDLGRQLEPLDERFKTEYGKTFLKRR